MKKRFKNEEKIKNFLKKNKNLYIIKKTTFYSVILKEKTEN